MCVCVYIYIYSIDTKVRQNKCRMCNKAQIYEIHKMCKICRINTIFDTTLNIPHTKLSNKKFINTLKGKGKVHPCTGTEALHRPYGP